MRPPKIYVMVGLPRCGKSSWASLHRDRLDATVVSRDDTRKVMGIERYSEPLEPLIGAIEYYMVRSLAQGLTNVIIDETNHTAARRRPWFELAREGKAEVILVLIEKPSREVIAQRCEESGFPIGVIAELEEESEKVTPEELQIFKVWGQS